MDDNVNMMNEALARAGRKEKVSEILYKIKNCMSAEHPIVKKNNQNIYTLTIGNKVMIDDLLSLGLTPNKSLDVKFPVFSDKSLYSHFIRGYFDGDGSICLCRKNWRVNFVSGSRGFMESLEAALTDLAGTSRRPVYASSTSKAHYLVYAKNSDLIKLFNLFYDETSLKRGLFLPRKYKRFLNSGSSQGAIPA